MIALTDNDVARIADAVVQRMAGATQIEVLTRTEAMAYTKRNSDAAFSVWCAKHKLKAADRGRWSRTMLDRALQREARKRAA